MTTRLSQRKVKAGSPAYKNLMEEMQARTFGSGTDYIIPVGGIPRTDMTTDVQAAIAQAEASYVFPVGGITETDLSKSVQDRLLLSSTAYQKPSTGIPEADLDIAIQERLNEFKDFYVFPTTGIPYVDLDPDVQAYLQKAFSAYQKPALGIPATDLTQELQDILDYSLKQYIKPDGGIPLTDLEREVVTKEAFDNYVATPRITDHDKLQGIGEYTHPMIDDLLDEHEGILLDVTDEIEFARGEYSTIGRRLDSAFFERHDFIIKDLDFNDGSMTNLMLSDDNNLHFPYVAEPIPIKYYDMSTTTGYEQANQMRVEEVDMIDMRWPSELVTMNAVKYSNNVGIVIDGFIYAPKNGVYEFGVQASGSYQFVVNKSEGKFDASDMTGWDDDHVSRPVVVTLTGGQFYRFSLIGKNLRTANSIVRIVWKRPGEKTYEPVKKEYFTKVGYNSPDLAIYETDIIDTEKLDIRKLNWSIVTDHKTPHSYIELEYRQGEDGITFSEWIPYSFGQELESGIERFQQARLTFMRGMTNRSPVLKEIHLNFLSNKNRLYHEWEEAREGYVTLRAHMDALNERINGVEDLATSIDHSVMDTSWLQNVRFEHVDINLMRMHWEQLKALKTSAHVMPSGFVEDFHDLKLMDTNFQKMEVKNSRLYPVPIIEVFDTDLDWTKWDRLNTSPESGSLKLTYVANAGLTGPGAVTLIDNTKADNISMNINRTSVYQPFSVPKDTYMVNTVTIGPIYTSQDYRNSQDTLYFYISSLKADGTYDATKEKLIGTRNTGQAKLQGQPLTADYLVPANVRKFAIRIYSNGNSLDGSSVYMTNNATGVDPVLTGANEDSFVAELRDNTGKSLANRFMKLKVVATKGYHSEGEAQIVIDAGIDTHFIEPEIDVTLNAGSIEITYASSEDGNVFSTPVSVLSQVPHGRYLRVWTRLSRTASNQAPMINRLAIRHNPKDVIFQTIPVHVVRVPTHAIVDVVDSENADISYEISRDGGQTFRPIVPGIQTDLRDIGAGQEMIIRMFSERFRQDGDVWIDYIGLQTITHEDFNDKSVIVSHHQVEMATQGQKHVDVSKPYFVGDNSLQVYVNGVYQISGVSYDEINNRAISMRYPLMKDDIVVLRVATAAYAFADNESLAEMLIQTKQTIDDTLPFLQEFKPRVELIEAEQIVQNDAIMGLDTYFTSEVNKVNNRIDNEVETINTRVEEVNTNASIAIESVVTDLIALDTEVGELTTTVTTIGQQVTAIDTVIQGLSSTDSVLSQQLALLQQTVELIKTDLEEVKALMAVGTTDFEELKGRVDVVENGIKEINTQLGTIVTRLNEMDAKDTQQDTTILDVDTRLKAAETDLPVEISRVDTETNSRITTVQDAIMQAILDTDEINDAVAEDLATRLTEIEFIHPSHVERISRDKLALNLDSLDANPGANGIQLSTNVTFPSKGQWDSVITWQSDKPQFVSAAGVVNKPSHTQGDQAVLLTATIAYGGLTDTKVFTVNVEKLPPSGEEMVLEDKNALSISDIDQDDTTPGIQVTTNVVLPTVGSVRNSTIAWESSNPAYFHNSGVVTQPEFAIGDIVVILTATLTNGSAIETKAFSLTVPALPEPPAEPEPEPVDPPVEQEPETPVEPDPEVPEGE